MSYLVLARKYRPAAFDSVCGQEHVTRTLSNSIRRDKVSHAILLSGPRGVGKTSIARIIAKCLNCSQGLTAEPCLTCTNCVEITNGTSLAVREIDGASHNSVDNVRELMDSFRSLPAPGYRYKVYIIDEVHMLSTAAFNALLKSLEEPPANTVFILATTEVHKVPDTVISRCQRHDLRAIRVEVIEERLKQIAAEEKLTVESGVFRMVARLADGSMRDSQSLFDRVQAFCDGRITVTETSKLLGAADKGLLFGLSRAIFFHEPAEALERVGDAFSAGVDSTLFIKDFASHFRELLLAKVGGEMFLSRLGISNEDQTELLRQVQSLELVDLQDTVHVAREGADTALRSAHPKYAMEALVVRLATREPTTSLVDLLDRLQSGGFQGASGKTPPQIRPKGAPSGDTSTSLESNQLGQSSKNPNGLNWGAFVAAVSEKGSKIVLEHLKRLSAVRFEDGYLEARGPEFSINYLKRPQEKEKLTSLLTEFTKTDRWKIHLEEGKSIGAPEPGSLLHVENTRIANNREAKEATISSHPKIQSLQKAFPGSSIEGIKTKDRR